jgi:O-antigen ligase
MAWLLSVITLFLLALPWLNPFSPGPTPAVMPWLTSLASLALLLLVALHQQRARFTDSVAGAWLMAALLSALIGLLQYFGAAAALMPWVNSTSVGEAFGNLRQRNQFATLTNIGLAALLWWVARLASPTDAARPAPIKVQYLIFVAAISAAALLALGNAASSSRTGLVQLVMLIALAGVWRARASAPILLTAALAYAIGAWALPGLAGLDPQASGMLARLHEGDVKCASRLTLWSNVLHLIAQRPWLGWGWGELDYAHFITLYPGERFCEILDNAHNLPLHLAVELGLPLALLVCGGGLWLAWRTKPWREAHATRQLAWSVLAVILLHSLLEYPLWYGPFQIAFGLSLWLLWRPLRQGPEKFERFRPLAPVWYALTASILLAISAYAMWDYQRVSQIYRVPGMRSAAYRDNTLEKISDSWLFRDQVRFAELTTTDLTLENAAYLYALAQAMLHFSPEPRVIEKLIESATLLGRRDEAQFYLARYQAAFPEAHARWAEENAVQ